MRKKVIMLKLIIILLIKEIFQILWFQKN